MRDADRAILADLYLSRGGFDFLEELVERFGSRFGGTPEEHGAAEFIAERFREMKMDSVTLEEFQCPGWTRKETELKIVSPVERDVECIALPFCPPGEAMGPLVYLGDGAPQEYLERAEEIRGAIVMVTTATPQFYHRAMHRGEKIGRAIDLGAAGFIWMRGEPGGLPETGSIDMSRDARSKQIPSISVSYETGMELVRFARRHGGMTLKITSTNEVHDAVTSYNVAAELQGKVKADEIIVIGAHYDGHDISQSAMDNGAGTAVMMEAAKAMAPHRDKLQRTVRFVAFAQEEMGLFGAEHHAEAHVNENIRFMLNLDGAGRGRDSVFALQGWPEGTKFFRDLFGEMYDEEVSVGDRISLYSDMYPFAARGIPAATYASHPARPAGAPRGFGHTYWDSLDKVPPRALQRDASRVARLAMRLASMADIPLGRKDPAEFGAKLKEMGLDVVLRYEGRPVPGETDL